jgi:peptidoglycan/xylan/chitin deacetylase (PgdA/CDA1 family)
MTNNITIITYHYIRNPDKKFLPNLKVLKIKKFEKQIKYLKKNHKILSYDEINYCVKNNKKFPNKSCWLTFDDGYKDHIDNVYPILKKYNLFGSFFPTVTKDKKEKVMNVNKIQMLLASHINENEIIEYAKKLIIDNKKNYRLREFKFYEKNFKFKNQFDNLNISFIKNLLQFGIPSPLREKIIDNLFKEKIQLDEKIIANNYYLSENDILKLKNNGMHIGGHGYHHLRLGKLKIKDQVDEIKETYTFLRKIYKNEKNFVMCYPFGDYNKDTITVLKKFNFNLGLTTSRKVANFQKANKFEIPRLDTNDIII